MACRTTPSTASCATRAVSCGSATSEGLSLFDGYRFTNFGVDQGLPNPYVTAILETREGEYRVATYDGLCKFDPRGIAGRVAIAATGTRTNVVVHPMFMVFRPAGGDHRASAFTALLEGRDGTIWCGTRNGLFRLARAGGRVQLQPIDVALPDSRTQKSASSMRSWRTGTERYGLARRAVSTGAGRMARVARYSRTTGLPDDYIHALLADRDGHVWVGTRYGGLLELATDASRRPPTVTRAYNHGNGFIADWIFAVNELEDGRLWVGTNTGLAEFSGRRPEARQALARVRQGQRVHLSRDCRRLRGPRRQHLARERSTAR